MRSSYGKVLGSTKIKKKPMEISLTPKIKSKSSIKNNKMTESGSRQLSRTKQTPSVKSKKKRKEKGSIDKQLVSRHGSNAPGTSKNYDKKKLSKVEALFNKQSFEMLDIKNVLNNWRILQYVYLSLRSGKPTEEAVNTYFLHTFKKQYNPFLNGFTKYNKIRKKIFTFMFLEFWTFYLLFHFCYESDKMNSKITSLFERILTCLTKNTFYVGLILLKAANNSVLNLNAGFLQDFVTRSQSFNFQTGVPLIKTLRSNNEEAYDGLKRVLKLINNNFNRFFNKTYSTDFLDYSSFIERTSVVFAAQMNSPEIIVYQKMEENHFYGKDNYLNLKGGSNFWKESQDGMTTKKFLEGSLHKERNKIVEIRQRKDTDKSKEELKKRNLSSKSKGSRASHSKFSSKYSNAYPSKKAGSSLSSRNYKLKASQSRKFRKGNNSKSKNVKDSRKLKEGYTVKTRKGERSLSKASPRGLKSSRQGSRKLGLIKASKHTSILVNKSSTGKLRSRKKLKGANSKGVKRSRDYGSPSLKKMMSELKRDSNKAQMEVRNVGTEEEREETEVSQNHLRKLENLARDISVNQSIKAIKK